MPRPTRAQGRPRTTVIPAAWGGDHAPVAHRAMRGTCQALPPGDGPLVYDEAQKVSRRAEPEPTYDGPCRIQKLNAQDRTQVAAEADVTTVGYLITLSLLVVDDNGHPTADQVGTGHRIKVTDNPDTTSMVDTFLSVTSVVRGTERFEVDLFCTEDQSTPTK